MAQSLAPLDAGVNEELGLENIVCQAAGEGPTQPCHRSPLQVVLHGAASNAKHYSDLAATRSATRKPQHLSYVSHGQLSFCRH
ncbi:hypothetical protein A6R70_25540 [Agrobacterium rubi]|uniref:hypothetical protein n=1 Tax=Rhizobium/Agrobacterium group TaxID=227290 RepID=UPI00155DBD9E|nr:MULTISPECIES: hypothetical protein [Rhizobium/Agrobacterium group]MCL6655622.1 hypothetical protein [Agrobacterium rubi]